MVAAFTRGEVILDVWEGGKFELFGGNVIGEFVMLEPNKMIRQKWRFKRWPSGHYSEVVFSINQLEDCTNLCLEQTGIPTSDLEHTKDGWHNYYWEGIKRTFGFGAMLF